MQSGQPAVQLFADPLALLIRGEDAEAVARDAEQNRHRWGMRMFIAVRTRFTEDASATALARGVRQLLLLGAGLDTYG